MDWFLYDNDLRHERVKHIQYKHNFQKQQFTKVLRNRCF